MTLAGTVRNGVVVLENGSQLAEGTAVVVIVKDTAAKGPDGAPTMDDLLALAGTVDDLPSDMARNHDQYIHGAPSR